MFPEIQPADVRSGRERLPDTAGVSGYEDTSAGTLTIELVHGDQSVRTIRVAHSGAFAQTANRTDRVVHVQGVYRLDDTGDTE